MNDVVTKSRDLVNEKIEEFRQQKAKYEALWDENQQLNTYKRNVMILETEKRELETRLVTLTVESAKSPAAAAVTPKTTMQVGLLSSTG